MRKFINKLQIVLMTALLLMINVPMASTTIVADEVSTVETVEGIITVQDEDNQGIAGAHVSIKNQSSNETITVIVDVDGKLVHPFEKDTAYLVQATGVTETGKQFKPSEEKPVQLSENGTVDFVLQAITRVQSFKLESTEGVDLTDLVGSKLIVSTDGKTDQEFTITSLITPITVDLDVNRVYSVRLESEKYTMQVVSLDNTTSAQLSLDINLSTFDINVNAGEHGSVEVPVEPVIYNGMYDIKIRAERGYWIKSVKINGHEQLLPEHDNRLIKHTLVIKDVKEIQDIVVVFDERPDTWVDLDLELTEGSTYIDTDNNVWVSSAKPQLNMDGESSTGFDSYNLVITGSNGTQTIPHTFDEPQTTLEGSIDFGAIALEDGEYTIELHTSSMGVVVKSATQTIHVDTQAPEITEFRFIEKNEGSIFNPDYKTYMSFNVKDSGEAVNASGVQKVNITIKDIVYDVTPDEDGNVLFEISETLRSNFDSSFVITASDNVGNTVSENELTVSRMRVNGSIVIKDNEGNPIDGAIVRVRKTSEAVATVVATDLNGEVIYPLDMDIEYEISVTGETESGLIYEGVEPIVGKYNEDKVFELTLEPKKQEVEIEFVAGEGIALDLLQGSTLIVSTPGKTDIILPVNTVTEPIAFDMDVNLSYTVTLDSQKFDATPITIDKTTPSPAKMAVVIRSFDVSTMINGNGTVTSNKTSVTYGDSYTLEINANRGYWIESVKVNGVEKRSPQYGNNLTNYSLTLENVTENQDVVVKISQRQSNWADVLIQYDGITTYRDSNERLWVSKQPSKVKLDGQSATGFDGYTLKLPGSGTPLTETFATPLNTLTKNHTLDDLALADGKHTFQLNTTIDGVSGLSDTQNFYLDTKAPEVSQLKVTGLKNNLGTFVNASGSDISFKVTDPGNTNSASGVAKVLLTINGVEYSLTPNFSGMVSHHIDPTQTSDFDGTFTIKVIDNVGNTHTINNTNIQDVTVDGTLTNNIVLDTQAPKLLFTGDQSGQWLKDNTKFSFTATEEQAPFSGIKSIEILYREVGQTSFNRLDYFEEDSSVESYVRPQRVMKQINFADYENLIPTGSYEFKAILTDYAGNETHSEEVHESGYFHGRFDREDPIIDNVVLLKKESFLSAREIIKNIFEEGTYYNNDVTLDVYVRDLHSGVNEVTLYKKVDDNFEIIEVIGKDDLNIEGNGQFARFEIKVPETIFDEELYVQVSDNTANTTEIKGIMEYSDVLESNRLVLESIAGPISITNHTAVAWVNNDVNWFNEIPEFEVSASDAESGMHTVLVEHSNNGVTTTVDSLSYDPVGKNDTRPHYNKQFDPSELGPIADHQLNTFKVSMTDYAGNKTTEMRQYRFDDKKPTIEHTEIVAVSPLEENQLPIGYYDYRTYFNDTVSLNIDVKDDNSGVGKVIVYHKVNDDYVELYSKTASEMVFDQQNAQVKFEIQITNNVYDEELFIQVVDNANNKSDIVGIKEHSNTLKSNRLMLEKNQADLSLTNQTAPAWVSEGIEWYNEIPTILVASNDNESGLRHVIVEHKNSTSQTMNEQKFAEVHVGNETIAYDQTIQGSDVKNVSESDMNTYKVNVRDYAGNLSEASMSYRYDNRNPEIVSIEVIDGETNLGEGKLGNDGVYAYYVEDKATVKVSATDGEFGSGVASFTYFFKDSHTGVQSEEKTIKANAEGTAEIVIPANAKGNFYVKATDFLGNTKEEFISAEGMILETQQQHDAFSKIDAPLPSVDLKDKAGLPLYKSDVTVPLTIDSTYAGIDTVDVTVKSPFDSANDQNIHLEINQDGTLSDSSWKTTESDRNIVTQVTRNLVIKNNSNAIVVEIVVKDRVGFETRTTKQLSIDKTVPVIDVSFDNNTYDTNGNNALTYFDANRIATVRVTERNFNTKDAKIEIVEADGRQVSTPTNWIEYQGETEDERYYEAKIAFTNDGQYQFTVDVTDGAGNKASQYKSPEFVVDKTAPVISAAFTDGNVEYSSNTRTLVVSVEEKNFDPSRVIVTQTGTLRGTPIVVPSISSWTSEGTRHTATLVYADNGDFTYQLSLTDRSGNVSNTVSSSTFTIDKEEPKITFSGIENFSANNGIVMPVVEIDDSNFDMGSTSVVLTGVKHGEVSHDMAVSDTGFGATWVLTDFETKKEMDDIYVLSVNTTDKAGNTFSDTLTFSVNRFGSTYMFDTSLQEIDGKYVNKNVKGSIIEVNVDAIQEDSLEIKSVFNGQPKVLKDTTDYQVIDRSSGSGTWTEREYLFKETVFKENGKYSLEVRNKDAAGNSNNNVKATEDKKDAAALWFGIDTVNPVVMPHETSHKTYAESSHIFEYAVTDNISVDHAKVYINGEIAEHKLDGDTLSVEVTEQNSAQEIVVEVYDLAGNVGKHKDENILITTNIFVRFFNSIFFIPTLGITAVGVGYFFFILFKRRKKEEETPEN